MEITEVRVALRETQTRPSSPPVAVPGIGEPRAGEKRLKAYATLTFDRCFVVRNVKVIEGKNGLFVAMPSRKITRRPCMSLTPGLVSRAETETDAP